jgi:hypothetical protein
MAVPTAAGQFNQSFDQPVTYTPLAIVLVSPPPVIGGPAQRPPKGQLWPPAFR